MRNAARQAWCLLACVLIAPFAASPAGAEEHGPALFQPSNWSDHAPEDSNVFGDLVLRLDDIIFGERDVVSLWTEFAASGRRIGGDELRLDWTPVSDQLISRRNRAANFKPSSGLGFDFDAPSESVVLEWRIGF